MKSTNYRAIHEIFPKYPIIPIPEAGELKCVHHKCSFEVLLFKTCGCLTRRSLSRTKRTFVLIHSFICKHWEAEWNIAGSNGEFEYPWEKLSSECKGGG